MKKGLFQSTKSKLVAVGTTAGLLATQVQAATVPLTIDPTTLAVGGSIDLTLAYGVGAVVLTGLAGIWVIKRSKNIAN